MTPNTLQSAAKSIEPQNMFDCMDAIRAAQAKLAKNSREQRRILKNLKELRALMQAVCCDATVEAAELDWQREYDGAVATLKRFKLLPKKMPSLADVQASFTKKALKARSTLRYSRLVLVPNVSFGAMIRAIDESGLVMEKTRVDENFDCGTVLQNVKITALYPAFIEALQQLKQPEGTIEFGDSYFADVKRDRASGKVGIDRYDFALLQMDGLRRGTPLGLDNVCYLMTDSLRLTSLATPFGKWNSTRGQLQFGVTISRFLSWKALNILRKIEGKELVCTE
jgi:hypothetical protein